MRPGATSRGRAGRSRRLVERGGASDLTPVLRASGPADLLAAVPYLLGFRPAESLVALALRGRRVELVARIDLPGTDQSGTDNPAPELDWAATLRQLAAALRSTGPDGLALLGFSTVEGRAEAALDDAVAELSELPLIEVVHADGHRWWSRLCTRPCCPVEGTPYDCDASPLAAEAVLAGLAPLPDRAAVQARVAGPAADEITGLEAEATAVAHDVAIVSADGRAQEMRRRVEAALPTPSVPVVPVLDRPAALRLATLALDLDVRDVAWALIDPGSASAHVDLWAAVVQVCPPRLAPAPLCLLSMAAWVDGDGTLMVCAFSRALELRPDYGMAQLLSDLNRAALPPSTWEEVVGPLRSALGLHDLVGPLVDDPAQGPARGSGRASTRRSDRARLPQERGGRA